MGPLVLLGIRLWHGGGRGELHSPILFSVGGSEWALRVLTLHSRCLRLKILQMCLMCNLSAWPFVSCWNALSRWCTTHSAVYPGFDIKCHSPIRRDLRKGGCGWWYYVAIENGSFWLTGSKISRIMLFRKPENVIFLRNVCLLLYLSWLYLPNDQD